MKEALTKALAKAIFQAYPSIPIYEKWQETAVKKPCFFLICQKAEEKPLLGRRVMVRFSFRVSCYSEKGLEEIKEEGLRGALAEVQMDGVPVRPMDVKSWIEEWVLHWEGTFSLIGWREEEASDWMEELEWKER